MSKNNANFPPLLRQKTKRIADLSERERERERESGKDKLLERERERERKKENGLN